MCGYEGGWSADYTDSLSSALSTFRNACKAAPNLDAYLYMVFQGFIGQSDATFTAEFPSTFYLTDFVSGGNPTTYVWTLLKGEIDSANTPQFDFITRFNKGRRAINLRLRIHG
jgi:hypothetical protein